MHFLGRSYLGGGSLPYDAGQGRYWLSRSAATGRPGAQRDLANLERHLQQGGPVGAPRPRAARTATAPSLADQVLETQRRQNRENCAAAAQGANRVCNPTR
jgi:hypothetical protein